MKFIVPIAALIILLPALARAQTAPSAAFEIADVHVSPHTRNPFLREALLRHGRYEIHQATLVDLIQIAYSIAPERVLGGPIWLENERFDIVAKAPTGATLETAKPMLQSLLTDRFGLTFHKDTKTIPAYGLKAGKHPALKEASDSSAESTCKFIPPVPAAVGAARTAPVFTFACRNMTMPAFAEALHSTVFLASVYLKDRLVVDETELKGAWDFDLKFTPRGMGGPDGPMPGQITLFESVEKLGLRLDPVQVPLPVIVVDRAVRTPTANPPNVAEVLHLEPPPTEFDVAEIKPTAPDFRGMRLQIQPGGRVNIAGVTLKFLVEQAWDVTDDMLVGAPKWMEDDRYDIVAKAATSERNMDIDELWPMLRALLAERFKFETHFEQRPATAYTLTAVKPKMNKADPTSRVKCKEGPAADGKDPRDTNPVLGRLITCQNMTMAQFAEKLKENAPGYIHAPVLDATGLEGGYDFTLSFSPAGAGSRSPGGAVPTPEAGASDPNGAITLFEAVQKQLGLKLEAQKRPVQVLVIDHANQKPTDN